MITHRQYIKNESPVAVGSPPYCVLGRRSSSSGSSTGSSSATAEGGEMPIKLEDRLNELESNAVRALLSLGEAFVSQVPYRTQIKKQPDAFAYARPLQPQQINAVQHQQPPRSVIVKAEPMSVDDHHQHHRIPTQQQYHHHHHHNQPSHHVPLPQMSPSVSSSSGHGSFIGSPISSTSGLNQHQQQSTIKFTPATICLPSTAPPPPPVSSSNVTSTPVSIQHIASTSSPVISTIFYQIPATAAGSSTNGTGRPVMSMSPSFTIIPGPNGRPMFSLQMNSSPLVKLEPGTSAPGGVKNGTPMNMNMNMNWSNIQLVKVPRSSVEKTTYSTLAPLTALPKEMTTPTKLLPSPGKGDGKSSSFTPKSGVGAAAAATANGKTPTKSRARRRSQSTPKGQSRNARVSSGSNDFVVSSVEGLPNIVVDGYEVPREIWAKAFLQNDIIHAAGTLFNALFSSDEIKNCTLNGRNGTRQLCPEKRHAIFKIVAWMRNKCQDPYSFNKSPEDTKILSRDEQQMIEKKVFVERRYQTSRKIRDLPSASPGSTPVSVSTNSSPAAPPPTVTSTTASPSVRQTTSPSLSPNGSFKAGSSKLSSTTPKKGGGGSSSTTVIAAASSSTTSPPIIHLPLPQRRDSSGSFSSICSSSEDDKGIPKIALIQSSEIIANYFQSAEPLPIPSGHGGIPLIPLNNHKHDEPPPMKMQKVG